MIRPRHLPVSRLFACAPFLCAFVTLTVGDLFGEPVPGQILLDETDYPSFAVTGEGASRVTAVAGVSSRGRILKITTAAAGDSFPRVRATLRHATPLARGEILHARFLMRTTDSARESGEGATQFELQDSVTFSISGQYSARAVGQWREFNVPLRLVRECPPGRAVVNFRVGDRPQTIEISDLRVVRPQPAVTDIKTLPATPVQAGYEGSEPGAPWRAAARERIERHRRSPLAVAVVDGAGSPVSGIEIHVSQRRHAYRFGAAVRAGLIAAETPEGERYRATISRHFNTVTLENDLKWERWLGDSATPLAAARWCRDNGIDLRGHTLLWPTKTRLPGRFGGVAGDPDALRAVLEGHITDIAGRTSPLVRVWDVVNEPFRNHDFMDVLGYGVMADWFRVARRAAPEARLYLNDYGIITGGGMDSQHQAHYERLAGDLISAGAPLDGFGFQAHFDRILTPPARVLDILDRFARLQREMEITEYSTQVEDPALAADYLRDMLTVFYSHPSTTGFILWSFIKNSGFRSTTWLQDSDGNPGSAGRVWHDLIYKQWWTDAHLVSAADGSATTPATHGRHLVTVRSGGLGEVSATVDVPPGGASVRITIPDATAAVAHGKGDNET
ncbi:MAG: endo-1,4-beta-xylanase [Opitutaceae bacterium]|jgi:GH35 family endo-1,4-beta-xylanase|nr:endo-1,4-beta-xylanase [Opitutaceae bacterium]